MCLKYSTQIVESSVNIYNNMVQLHDWLQLLHFHFEQEPVPEAMA